MTFRLRYFSVQLLGLTSTYSDQQVSAIDFHEEAACRHKLPIRAHIFGENPAD